MDKEESLLKFDESFASGGIPLLKSNLHLNISYINKNFYVDENNAILNSKNNILEELKKAYKFVLSKQDSVVIVNFK